MDVSLWKKHIYKFELKDEYLDALGHMNNVSYFRVFEDARCKMIVAGGYTDQLMAKLQQAPVVLKIEVEFRKEVRGDHQFYVESSTLSYEGKVQKVLQELCSEELGVHCSAAFTMGLFDMQTRRLVLPNQEWLKASGLLPLT